MKRAIIVHQWGSTPENDWYPWLRSELEKRDYSVLIPQFPETNAPKIDSWVLTLEKAVGESGDILLIGHSIGCQTILRYLEKLSSRGIVNTILFVAPWLTLTNLEDRTSEEIAKPWLQSPIDFEKVKKQFQKLIALFSNNDLFVPLENERFFKEKLGANIIILNNRGHFTQEDKITSIPEILNLI